MLGLAASIVQEGTGELGIGTVKDERRKRTYQRMCLTDVMYRDANLKRRYPDLAIPCM